MSTGGYVERRRPNRLLMLAIASIASVVAAIVTSEVWDGGVVGTAAITPVIVALVTDVLSPLTRERGEQGERREPAEPERPAPRRGFLVGALVGAIVIGLVAFVIAAVSLTLPEVVADKSITGDSAHTTYFGDNEDKPWAEGRNWSDCFDDIEQCLRDIIEAGP